MIRVLSRRTSACSAFGVSTSLVGKAVPLARYANPMACISHRTLADNARLNCNNPFVPISTPSRHQRAFHTSGVSRKQETVDYLLADVGEGITECEIIKWFVKPGSTVEEFDVLVEVQSDKASVEITSRYAGKVIEHCYNVGEVARVGSPLCRIQMENESGDEREDETSANKSNHRATEGQAQGQKVPQTEVDVTLIEGAQVRHPTSAKHSTLATPAVRRITRDNNVDISQIHGTGKDGRVTKEDVHVYVQQQQHASGSSPMSASPQQSSAQQGKAGYDASRAGPNTTIAEDDIVVPLSSMRKAMFKAMTSTWTIPHFGYSDEIDITELDEIRRRTQSLLTKEKKEGHDIKLTLLPFLVKAMALAMQTAPIFRSQLDVSEETLHQRSSCDISIALSTGKGLLTPTIASTDLLSTLDIAKHIGGLQRAASSSGGMLTRAQLGPARGGTLTLSNIGSVGGTGASPLIPPTGQLAIGALGRAKQLPRYSDGGRGEDVVKRLILPVAFTADHRVVEGVELARLVDKWKRLVEEPCLWVLKLK